MLTHLPHPQHTQADQASAAQTRIGELLVQDNLITPLDCKQVLDIQEKENLYTDKSFLLILEASGRLSEKKKNRLLALPDIQAEIARTATSHELLTAKQLEICLETKTAYQTLPEALVAQNLLSQEQVDFLLHQQLDPELLASQAVTMGIVSATDIAYCRKVRKSPRSFGEICCSLDLVTPLDLYHLLEKHGKQIKFGEVLIHLHYADAEKVNQALDEQKSNNKLLGEILIAQKIITPEQCQEVLSLQANIPFERLEEFSYDDDAKDSLPRLVSARYAEEHLLLPISTLHRNLKMALVHPEAIEAARELMGLHKELHIQCVLIPEQRFRALFEELYNQKPALEIRKTLLHLKQQHALTPAASPDFMRIDLDEDLETVALPDLPFPNQHADVEEAIHSIVRHGIDHHASDIHLEQNHKGLTVRYRIDGVIKDHAPEWLQRCLQENSGALLARLKVLANLDPNEKRVPQDGIFRTSYLDEASQQKSRMEFRVASCPAITGESITIHILDPRKAKLSLRQNGHSPHVLEPLGRRLNSDASIILVAGPNGSGKSSTLYGILKLIYDPTLKIVTAEDPIEYNFPGILQTQVNLKIGLDFPQLLRSFLRLDPDIILVGELRDKATATMAFDAARSGHLVLSSLYANDSLCALYRLLDLGVDRSQIAASLACVLAQRLVRKICASCLTEYQPEPKEWSQIFNKYPAHLQFFRGTGCKACGFSGFKGRTVLSELYSLDTPHAFIQGAELAELKEAALLRGMKTMVHDGLLKMSSTTLTEIGRVLPFEMLENHRHHETATASPDQAAGHCFLLRDPEGQPDMLAAMLDRFNTLLVTTGEQGVAPEPFRSFIATHFKQLCADHNAGQVLFTLTTSPQGTVEILAQAGGAEGGPR